jgi:ribonuclease HI
VVGGVYADDVNLNAKTRAAQVAQNNEVKAFAEWHDGVLHPTKTVAAGFTTAADGSCVDARSEGAAQRAASDELTVLPGKPVDWVECGALRHLGVWVSLIDGGASPEATASVTRLLYALGGVIDAQQLRAATTVVALNTFVAPKIEHMLHTAQPTPEEAKRWDQLVSDALCRRAGVTMRGAYYAPRPAAVTAITSVTLPEHALRTARIADAYFRVNGRDGSEDTAAARRELELTLRDEKAAALAYPLRRMARAIEAMRSIGWRPRILTDNDRAHAPRSCERGQSERKVNGGSGARCTAHTDGSASSDAGDTSTAWAVLFGGEWLSWAADSWLMALKEDDLNASALHGAPLFSGYVEPCHSHGSYGAELRAIMEALRRAPRGVPLTISTDSQAAIDAIAAWRNGDDISRKRLRTPLRQFLQPIAALIRQREAEVAAEGSGDELSPVVFAKVQAHSGERTSTALANRIVDCAAKHARAAADACEQFDVATGERWMAIEEEITAAVAEGATTRAKAKAARARGGAAALPRS